MHRASSSRQNTAASRPSYKCPHCHKVFHSSNALGGHQHAHRHDEGVRRLSPILAAVLNHPIPLDGDDELLASPQAGTRFTLGSETGVQPGFNGQGDGSSTKQGREDLGLEPLKDYPRVRPVSEEYPEECLTKDLLREWVPMSSVGEWVKVERSSERTITDPIFRVSKGNKDGDEVTSKGKVDIDLELKLGF